MSGGLVDRHQVALVPGAVRDADRQDACRSTAGHVHVPGHQRRRHPAAARDQVVQPARAEQRRGACSGAPTNLHAAFRLSQPRDPGAVLLDLVDSTHYHDTVPPVNRTELRLLGTSSSGVAGYSYGRRCRCSRRSCRSEYGANELLGPTVNAGTARTRHGPGHAAAHDRGDERHPHRAARARASPWSTSRMSPASRSSPRSAPFAEVPGVGVFCLRRGRQPVDRKRPRPALGGPAARPGVWRPRRSTPRVGHLARTRGCGDPDRGERRWNAVVDSVATAPVRDQSGSARSAAAHRGRGLSDRGGRGYTSDFIRGGLFGLDGIHPNDLGYALLANELIASLNSKFGCMMPEREPLAVCDHRTPRGLAPRRTVGTRSASRTCSRVWTCCSPTGADREP